MKINNVRMGGEEIFNLIVKDGQGSTIERWTVMKRDFPKVVKIIMDKYGMSIVYGTDKKTSDLDWAI